MKYLKYVNVKQGSASVRRFSNGNTLPLTQLPFAMTAFAPQTRSEDIGWFFHPADKCIEGIRLTHQPSPWIEDYGSLIFLPQKFDPVFSAGGRWSGYRPSDAVLAPNYMKLKLLKSRATFELTPTLRGAAIKTEYEGKNDNWFSVLPLEGKAYFKFVPEENTLYVKVHNFNGDIAKNFTMYCVVKFDALQIEADKNIVGTDKKKHVGNFINANNAGIHLKVLGDKVSCKIATSYISFRQAELNFERELAGKSFEEIKRSGEELWENYLSRVEIEANDAKQMKTFYSCLYRAFLYPHRCYELNAKGESVHYAPGDGKTYPGVRYTDNGFWDTYRTCYPFYALVAKDEYKEMCEGFVNDYLEGGWLPRWPSIGERGCMPSTLIDAVLCDAAVKGILTGKTLENAFEGMLRHSKVNSSNDDFGRSGAESYCQYGYVPYEVHRESVNLTADAAYGDWCIARIAELLGKDDIVKEYDKRAGNYKNLFDPETGFMRAKDKNGKFRPDFSAVSWGRDYTEGSAWQNSFAVPHDIDGLAQLYGGRDKLMAKMDELFATPPIYEVTGYGAEIHEMTEMAAADFGQCAISNQPSFHIPYIYSALGDVEKTSYWVEKMCKELFSYEDDGFPGDEDNGSMALWYVFSNIGIYPFCPGKNEFVRTKKLVKSVKILGREFDADSCASNKINYFDVVK